MRGTYAPRRISNSHLAGDHTSSRPHFYRDSRSVGGCMRLQLSGAMKLVVFGLMVSSSWGNGHATLWRGIAGALARRGHRLEFFERDVPYYAAHRDLPELPGG